MERRDPPTPLSDSTLVQQSLWRLCGAGSGVQAPVDGVEEQVGQREGQTGVRVDHVAVADQQVHVFPHRALPAQAGSLRGANVWGLGWSGERVRGQGGCHLGERGQLDVIVVETAVEGHRLAGVEGGRDLKRRRKNSEHNGSNCEIHLCMFIHLGS